MENKISILLESAKEKLRITSHLLDITYPALKDEKLFIKIIERLKETLQDTINKLHENESVCASCNGKVFAMQSAPLFLQFTEAGDYAIAVANFQVKHTKL